jgi:hypothetical protein
LRDKSGTTFARAAAPHVRLEGSIFAAPVDGREKVWTSLRTAGGIPGTLSFTHESATADRSYLEWELEALGQRIQGVTVLTLDSTGLIDNIALHHRPLGAVLAFSAEMGRRLSRSGCLLPSLPGRAGSFRTLSSSAQTGAHHDYAPFR